MPYWVPLCCFCAVLAMLPPVSSDSANPMIIALPIKIRAYSPHPASTKVSEPDDSDEEEPQEEEQRLVTRNYNPEGDQVKHSHWQGPDDDDQPSSHQPGFLTWNPGQNMMVLRINDVISVKDGDDVASEESEGFEDLPAVPLPAFPFPESPAQNWPHQGTFDFEDYARFSSDTDNFPGYIPDAATVSDSPLLSVPRNSSKRGNKKKNKRRRVQGPGEDGTVYGTDPVVHYARSRSRNAGRNYEDRDVPRYQGDDAFDFRDWWN